MDDNQVQYLPFHAINEFMVPEYRLRVLNTVMAELGKLPGIRRTAINNVVKSGVKISGFRNSTLAPASVRAKASVTLFERSPEFTGLTLQSWSELKPELRQQVFDFLIAREWDIVPVDADRSRLPGFQVSWPKGESYEVLGEAFAAAYPDQEVNEDDLRLMIVWLGNCLPYDVEEDEEDEADESAAE